MLEVTTQPCVGIANEIDALHAERAGLEQELSEASPAMKPFLLREIRRVNIDIGRLRQELRLCEQQNPPGPRPDLNVITVRPKSNHAARTIGFAALVKNVGLGIARGPFDIALSVTLTRGGVKTNYFRVFEVPAGVTLYGEPVAEQIQLQAQPAALAAFPGSGRLERPPIFSQEYITEAMVLPLHYFDDSPSGRYRLACVVDSEHRVSESNEFNNTFDASYWTFNPQTTARTSMLVTEEKTTE